MSARLPVVCAWLLITCHGYAQSGSPSAVTDVTRISFLSPGISYEKGMSEYQTLYVQGLMATSFTYSYSSAMGSNSSLYFDPAFTIQYRFYYNAAARQAKGKRTALNSLNYIAPILETVFSRRRVRDSDYDENNRRAVNTLGVAWGFQRNYPKRFSLDLNFGYGALLTRASYPDGNGQIIRKNVIQAAPVGQLTLGFWLNRIK